MAFVFGLVMVLLGLLAWGGQTLSWFAPDTAVRWSLTEDASEVEPVFYADVRGEALWDVFTLWTIVVAGVLLMLDVSTWAYFGLIGGGTYVYFAGRGILVRRTMLRRNMRIGDPQGMTMVYSVLAVWGVMGIAAIAAAWSALAG